jgi:hypothetical protein
MHTKKTYIYGRYKEVLKYQTAGYGAPGEKRKPRRKRTPEDVARQNRWHKIKKIQRLILANFESGWHVTLTYRKDARPPDMATAKKQVTEFVKAVRKDLKQAGIQFKWIRVTEKGSRGAYHHHFILEDIHQDRIDTKSMVLKHWKHGGHFFSPLYEDGEYEQLAAYLVKDETKEENTGTTYSRSRNLVIPQVKTETIHRKRWIKEPRPEKGYYIIKDSVYNGENPVTGYPYQRYIMKKIEKNGGGT